jgi:hypothetical protein
MVADSLHSMAGRAGALAVHAKYDSKELGA